MVFYIIILIICFLFVTAVYSLWHTTKFYILEFDYLYLLKDKFQETYKDSNEQYQAIKEIFQKDCPNTAISETTILKKLFEKYNFLKFIEPVLQKINIALNNHDSLVLERVETIYKLTNSNIQPNLTEISELTLAKTESKLHFQFQQFVISVLLIVGISGTFLAFKNILSNTELNFSKNTGVTSSTNKLKQYDDTLSMIYNGFGEAFYASIFGIIGTVILLFLKNVFINTLKGSFFSQLDVFTQTELIPFFSLLQTNTKTKSKDDILIDSIENISKEIQEFVKQKDQTVSDMSSSAADLKETVTTFSNSVSNDSGFIKTLSKLDGSIETFNSNYSALNQSISDSNTKFETLTSNLTSLTKELSTLNKADKLAEGLENVTNNLQNFVSKKEQTVSDMSTSAQHLKDTTTAFFDSLNDKSALNKVMHNLYNVAQNSLSANEEYIKIFIEIVNNLKSQDLYIMNTQNTFLQFHNILQSILEELKNQLPTVQNHNLHRNFEPHRKLKNDEEPKTEQANTNSPKIIKVLSGNTDEKEITKIKGFFKKLFGS